MTIQRIRQNFVRDAVYIGLLFDGIGTGLLIAVMIFPFTEGASYKALALGFVFFALGSLLMRLKKKDRKHADQDRNV